MSIASISSLSSSQLPSAVVPNRSQGDILGRQLEQAIQSGDLAGAQQAFNALSALGPSSSGPFSSPKLSAEFAAVGQALQAGDLGAAQQSIDKLGKDLLKQDYQIVKQDSQAGGLQGEQQALANLKGNFWAVTGQDLPNSLTPNAPASPSDGPAVPAINLQA